MLDLRRLVKNYEDIARSFNELVPWMAQISPSMVLNKDGSILVAYRFSGSDAEGKERYEVDHATRMVEQAQRVFSERITIWYTADRRRTTEYVGGSFENPVSEFVDAVWRNEITNGSQYTNAHYLSVLYTPPKGIDGALEKLAYFIKVEEMTMAKAISETIKSSIFNRAAFAYEAAQLQSYIAEFSAMLSSFEQTSDALSLEPLENEELLGYLYSRANLASGWQKVKKPRIPIYLDSLLTSDVLVDRDATIHFKGPDRSAYVGAVSVKDWPDLTEPGLLDALLAIPGEITYSQIFRFSDTEKSRSFMEGIERHNRNMAKSIKSMVLEKLTKEESNKVDEGKLLLANDAREAITEMTTDNRYYGHYNLTVLAIGETSLEAESILKMVAQTLRQRMYVTIREGMHLLSSIAGTLPGQAGALVRWFFVSGANVADLAPTRTLSLGNKTNAHYSEKMGYEVPALSVLPTEFNTPYYFNFHQADLAHTMTIGPAGTGKSTFNNFLISQFQKYKPSQTFIFDKDYSCRIPTILQGGVHIDLAGEHDSGSVKMNPLKLLADKGNWEWLSRWVRMLLSSQGHRLTAEEDHAVWNAIERLATQPASDWKLSMLSSLLDSRVLSDQLQQWCGGGSKARYFDNDDDTFTLSSFMCVEMNRLFQDEQVARAFMEYAFYRISQRLDGRPTLIYIEEAWFMLADEHFAEQLDDWLRTLRKKNAFVNMATQSLTEVSESKIFSTLIDNIPTKIFLPNANAMAHIDLYVSKFSLNHEQVNRIRTAIPKLNYYIVTPRLSRMVEVRLPKQVLAVVRSDTKAQEVFTRHAKSEEAGWMMNYIEEMSEGSAI